MILPARVPGLRRLPGPIVALAGVTALHGLLQWPGVATIGSAFGGLPSSLPMPALPEVSISQVLVLIGPAFAGSPTIVREAEK